MNLKKRVKAVVFDLGGVLAISKFPLRLIEDTHLVGVPSHCGHRSIGVHEYLANKLKIVLDQWFDAIDTIYAKSIEGKVSEKKVLSIISKNLNISPKKLEKLIIKAYRANFIQNKELYNFTFKLRKNGYKTAILSDQWPPSKKALVLKKYTKKFNKVIVSCDVGMRKPNPKIYRLLLKKLNLPAKQVVYIDNQEWNLVPARKLHIHAILFKNNEQLFKELKKLGVAI